MEKMCKWHNCQKEFTGRKNARYCSDTHYKDCDNPECDNTFAIKEMKRPAKTCSKVCADAMTKIGSTKEKVCQWHNCGKKFLSSKHDAMYCAEKHYDTCVVCGNQFEMYNLHKPSTTCSKRCAAGTIDFTERNKKSETTLMEKYGFKNASQVPAVKEKKKEAALRRYNVENVSQASEIIEKRKQTLVSHYGVDNPMRSEIVKNRLNSVIRDKYGVDNVFANKDIQKKIKKTLLEKYGVDNISKSPENRLKVAKTTMERFGVESVLALPENQLKAAETNKNRISKVNKKWQKKLLDATGEEFAFEQQISTTAQFADLGWNNILIDINPTVTHNNTISFVHFTSMCKNLDCDKRSHAPREKDYHQKRALAAQENGKTLLQYFDWYDPEIFINIVRAKMKQADVKIYARNTVLKEIKQPVANRFLRDNHLMGASNKQTLCLGLFDKKTNDLVHVQTYGKARLNKNYEWEAIRSCSKIGYHIPGGFSKCDKYFFEKMDPQSVISYVDLSISQGHTDSLFDGWRLLKINKPSAMWARMVADEAEIAGSDQDVDVSDTLSNDLPLFVKDSTARRVSADRMLGFEVGEKYPRFAEDGSKITNDFVMLSEGYVKMYDAGTMTFVWQKNQ